MHVSLEHASLQGTVLNMRLPTHRTFTLTSLLALLTLLQATGLYLFLKGFLLTRQTLDLPPLPHDSLSTHFDKVILVIIDALRFDFAVSTDQKQEHDYYRNQLPVFERLLAQQPSSSLLFQFRADPPTTTMQRVKGLMTGSLPTFIDAGSNFASSAVNEDHLLRQMRTRYDDFYFMGDDTWVNLYPDIFEANKTFESDSFKMFDLDTVDNRILEHLWPTLDQEQWQVAIAHFLGVDHCGHTFGPSHPNMATKLTQMNHVIEQLVDRVDDKTLLVVMGDHGMSVEGDHGGESVEELISTLFMYSNRPLTNTRMKDFYRQIHQSRADQLGYNMREIQERLHYDPSTYPIVSQIHLVPTLAYMLGVPIPFGNLGALIPDVLIHSDDDTLQHMTQAFRHNAHQVRHYLEQYSAHTGHPGFSADALNPIYEHLVIAEQNEATGDFENAIFEYDRFLTSTIKYCQAIWAQFDVGSMIVGISILVVTTCSSVYLSFVSQPSLSLHRAFIVAASTLFVSTSVAIVALKDDIRSHGWFEKMSQMDGVLALVMMICAAVLLFSIKDQRHSSFPCTWIIVLLGVIIHALTLGSNSFVVWEDRMTRFIAATLCVWWAICTRQLGAPLLVMVWIRFTGLAGQCREEQFPYCQYLHSMSFTADHPTAMLAYITFNALLISYVLPRVFKRRSSLNNSWQQWMYQAILCVVFVKQIQELYESSGNSIPLPWWLLKILNVYLPRMVYFFSMVMLLRARSSWWSFMSVWSATLAMLQRPLASTIMLTVPAIVELLTTSSSSSADSIVRLALMHVIGQHLFFVTGHQATFTSLPWKAAFIGFDDMNYYGGAILVGLSTLAGPLMAWISWPLLVSDTRHQLSLYMLMIMQLIPTCLSALFVLVLRRHLMTWKIFAPRFLLQALLGIGSHIAVILCAWFSPIQTTT